jgi:hypothetical protein
MDRSVSYQPARWISPAQRRRFACVDTRDIPPWVSSGPPQPNRKLYFRTRREKALHVLGEYVIPIIGLACVAGVALILLAGLIAG